MGSKTSDNETNPQGAVQDYLDLLLCAKTSNLEPSKNFKLPPSSSQANEVRQQKISVVCSEQPKALASTLKQESSSALERDNGELRSHPKDLTALNPARARRVGDERRRQPFSGSAKSPALTIATPAVVMDENRDSVSNLDDINITKKKVVARVVRPIAKPLSTIVIPLHAQWLDSGRPSWALQSFQCLLFTVGGMSLGVPLGQLGSIYPLANALVPTSDQEEGVLGWLSESSGAVKVFNTAKLIMPERYHGSMSDQFNYVITMAGTNWGLAVDSVSNAVTLDPDNIHWRTAGTKRPWLAGTASERKCAILEVGELDTMLG